MANIISAIFPCLPLRRERGIQLPTHIPEKTLTASDGTLSYHTDEKVTHLTREEAAAAIVTALYEADASNLSLITHVNQLAHQAGGCSEWLANKVREGIEVALKGGKEMSAVMTAAYDKAVEAAKVFEQFAEDHPLATAVFVTVIAIGVLVVLAPYVVELLGFGELGPIEGRFDRRSCLFTRLTE